MKKLLIISIVFLFGGFALAQNESAVGDENTVLVNAPEFSVVRNWQNTFTISSRGKYLVRDTLGMISATTGTVPYFSALITDTIPNLHINDMRFVDNYAFICGYVDVPGSHSCGVLGYFNLNDFYAYNTLIIKLHVYDDIREFSKMVAYYDVTDYKVVAIGSDIWTVSGISYHRSCVVEEDALATFTSNSYYPLQFTTSLFPKEYVTDLLLTDNLVVFIGYLFDMQTPPTPYNILCIRTADRHDVLNTMDNRILYDTGVDEINGNVHTTFLRDNHFAVSYVYQDELTGVFFTRIRTINLNSMKIEHSQEFPTYEKDEPIEMVYDSINNILTLLHPMPFSLPESYLQSYFVQINPFATTPYTAPVLTPKTGLFSSIDMFSNVDYVSTGENHWYYQHTTASQPNANNCPVLEKINIKIIPNPDKSIELYGSTLYPSGVTTEFRNMLVNTTKIDLQCDAQ